MEGDFSRFEPHFASNVKEKGQFSQVFNVLLNYWEIKPSQYEVKLHELALKDVRTISTFVPWAHVETDIFHSLKKFLKAAHVARLKARLFVMPELGVSYPNSGVPKDLLGAVSNLAVDQQGRVIYNLSAPNIFPIPSFSSPEVLKRFGNYLIKVGTVLSEVFAECGSTDFIEVVVSNSFFNYYRGQALKFSEHGDYSAAHVIAFRDFLDREYRSARNEGENEHFKMQLYENYNRHRFFTHIEKLLREKTDMVFSRKQSTCPVRHIGLYDPECSPEAGYECLMTELLEFHPSVSKYFERIVAGGYRNEATYLGNAGTYRRFRDQEKSFLMLASLIYSGEVAVMADEIFKLSGAFQKKLKSLVEFLSTNRMVRPKAVTYFSASQFSMEEKSFQILSKMAPGMLTVSASVDGTRPLSERTLFVDPKTVVRLVEFVQLLAAGQGGKEVVIPAPMSGIANYTKDAFDHFSKFKKGRAPLKLNLGLYYEVYEYHLGYVVFYDPHPFWRAHMESEEGLTEKMHQFFKALLGLGEVKSVCSFTDERVSVVPYVSEEDPSFKLLFLVNPTSKEVSGTLAFPQNVSLKALPQLGSTSDGEPILGRNFDLVIPPLGVITMRLNENGEGVSEEELRLWN